MHCKAGKYSYVAIYILACQLACYFCIYSSSYIAHDHDQYKLYSVAKAAAWCLFQRCNIARLGGEILSENYLSFLPYI